MKRPLFQVAEPDPQALKIFFLKFLCPQFFGDFPALPPRNGTEFSEAKDPVLLVDFRSKG